MLVLHHLENSFISISQLRVVNAFMVKVVNSKKRKTLSGFGFHVIVVAGAFVVYIGNERISVIVIHCVASI